MKKIIKKYRVLSPDGFDIERDRTYTKSEVKPAINNFIERYKIQGYYSMSDRSRLPLNEISNNCEILLA